MKKCINGVKKFTKTPQAAKHKGVMSIETKHIFVSTLSIDGTQAWGLEPNRLIRPCPFHFYICSYTASIPITYLFWDFWEWRGRSLYKTANLTEGALQVVTERRPCRVQNSLFGRRLFYIAIDCGETKTMNL